MADYHSCISVREPYASMLLDARTGPLRTPAGETPDPQDFDQKFCENRTRPTSHRGPLWIHSPKGVFPGAAPDAIRSAILGRVTLVACLPVDEMEDVYEVLLGEKSVNDLGSPEQRIAATVACQYPLAAWRHVSGPSCLIVTDPVRLPQPVLGISGAVGIWRYHQPIPGADELPPAFMRHADRRTDS